MYEYSQKPYLAVIFTRVAALALCEYILIAYYLFGTWVID